MTVIIVTVLGNCDYLLLKNIKYQFNFAFSSLITNNLMSYFIFLFFSW